MLRIIGGLCFLLALSASTSTLRADERSEAATLLRAALDAVKEAEAAAGPERRREALETAAALVAKIVRDYPTTYVGLRLGAGQPIGALDPRALEEELARARAGTPAPAEIRPLAAPEPARPATARPCDRGVVAGTRRGEPGLTLAEVIADCRAALAFEPGSARRRFQLARALSERAGPGDREEALRLLEAAAADGWTAAKAELCARYLYGIGTAKDPRRARLLCEAAAAEGSEQARVLLARGEGLATAQR